MKREKNAAIVADTGYSIRPGGQIARDLAKESSRLFLIGTECMFNNDQKIFRPQCFTDLPANKPDTALLSVWYFGGWGGVRCRRGTQTFITT